MQETRYVRDDTQMQFSPDEEQVEDEGGKRAGRNCTRRGKKRSSGSDIRVTAHNAPVSARFAL